MSIMTRHAVFIVNLLQDVNVLRPLILFTASRTEIPILVMASAGFRTRDVSRSWTRELDRICASVGASAKDFQSDYDAYRLLAGKTGIIFAASESSTKAHVATHDVFRVAPTGFLRVTLQHGYECVGFLHNYEQTAVWGDNVGFAADVICGWANATQLRSIAYSERSKLLVTGPTSLLAVPDTSTSTPEQRGQGLICENLHSVRLNVANLKGAFMREFVGFCSMLEADKRAVTLRPHPGGQYVLRNKVALPVNVAIENRPMYEVDLGEYDFGISAPSSVLIDMVFADIPTAVWHDADDMIDSSNYAGLSRVSSAEEWVRFAAAAQLEREAIVARQHDFIASTGLLTDPELIAQRFGSLLAGSGGPIVVTSPSDRIRVLFIANANIPTLAIYFLTPLADEIASGRIVEYLLTETQLNQRFDEADGAEASRWMSAQIQAFGPDIVISCRYSGPQTETVIDVCDQLGVPFVFHIDDDLLAVPIELGERKFRFHNLPERLDAVRTQLRRANLVYCGSAILAARVDALGFATATFAGPICHAPTTIVPVKRGPVGTIGYMGYDHMHDLMMVVPAIEAILDRFPDIVFHLFGGMEKPPELERFGERIIVSPSIADYEAFEYVFETIGWDIGICPLTDNYFNRAKTPIKWMDYTAAGIAMIASSNMIYEEICSDGCGLLAGSTGEWIECLAKLIEDLDARFDQVSRAQQRLRGHYTPAALANQVCGMIDRLVSQSRVNRRLLMKAI